VSKPTIVLVHGAFADSSSWNPVIGELAARGYSLVAVANPLRGVKSDASYVASIVASIKGPVVLVSHSYGGMVITNAANSIANVKSLVYVAAFAPDNGESALVLSAKFPGSTLGAALAPPVVLADGNRDLFIQQDKVPAQFAADLPLADARRMAVTQRPITEAALNEASGEAAWRSIPSWFIFGVEDRNIPSAALEFMANRAGARQSVPIRGASHVVMLSHPREVAALIEEAAA
jgi:pimeloyl-ACP methyl ester carboxylesterase